MSKPENRIEKAQSTTDVHSLILFKGEQRYAFLYTDATHVQVLRRFGQMAADPRLDFSWYDCAILAKKVRETVGKQ